MNHPLVLGTGGISLVPPPRSYSLSSPNCSVPVTFDNKTRCCVKLRHSLPVLSGFRSGKKNYFRCLSSLTPELKTTIDKVVTSQKVILFMKGTKDFPQCGFSNTVVQILKASNVPFETIDILENQILRQALKEYSSWPTFPQLYIDGEFFGGCDITVEAYQNGQLQELLEKTVLS